MFTRRSLLQATAMTSAALVLGDCPPAAAASTRMPRTSPESIGIDPQAVLAFIDGVEQKFPGGLHSFMLVRHGQVGAEGWWAPYSHQHPHMLYSLSKSFTSTAVGFAVTDGLLTVETPVTSFFKSRLPAQIPPNLAAMKVKHLLSMSTGHQQDATGPTRSHGDDWVRSFLALPVEHEPGSLFVYNSAATYMLSAIVQTLTGKTVLEYLRPRLFDPLGIEGETWETCPMGINTGGWGLKVKTEDIARFGQTYLQKGMWQSNQIVPEKWVAEATTKHINNGSNPESDWNQGYGYQFWRCRHGAFRGDGAFGQFCVVMPEQDAVLAITSGLGDMQGVLNVAWERLLPGMATEPVKPSLAGEKLTKREKDLTLPVPASKASASASAGSSKTYKLADNPEGFTTLTARLYRDSVIITLAGKGGERRLAIEPDRWTRSTLPILELADAPVAARGGWEDGQTFVARMVFYETPYVQTHTYKFTGDQVTVTRKQNVAFGPGDLPTLTGRVS